MKLFTKLASAALLSCVSFPALAGTLKMPSCLVYPTLSNGSVPCTGVVPVDSATGDPLSWQALFQSLGTLTSTTGGSTGTGTGITGYVGADGNTHSWVGDNVGHPAVSIFGTPTVSITAPLPAGGNAIGSVSVNGVVPVTQSGSWNVGITGPVAVTGAFYPAIQPVSGSITVSNLPATQAVNQTQVNGVAVATGTGASNTGTQRVAVSSDSTLGAKLVDGTGTAFGTSGNPIYTTSLGGGSSGLSAAVPVGGGASGNAEMQGYLGTDNTVYYATGDVLGHPFVSIATPLPAGTAAIGSITNSSFGATQSGTWNVGLASGTNAIGSVNVNGSVAVTGAFYQATQPVSIASVPLATGAATATAQATGNASVATVATNTTGLVPAITAQTTAVNAQVATIGTNGGTAPATAVNVGTFAATSTPLTFSAITNSATLGPWTPQLGRDIWAVFNVTGGTYTATVGITMTGSCSAATPYTAANGNYSLGTFSAAANEDIGAETRASAKWCVTVTPGTGASVSGGLYQ